MTTLDVSMSTLDNQQSIGSSSSTPLHLARYSKVRPQIGRTRPISAKSKTSYSSISNFGNCPICGGEFQSRGSFELPVSTLIRLAEYQVALQTRKKMQLQLRSSLCYQDDASTIVSTNSQKKLIDVYLGASHDGVPLTLMRAFPGLNCRSYVVKKNNPIWLYSLVKVCYDCWVEVKPRIYQNCKEYEKESSTYSTEHLRRTSITSNVSSSRHYFAKGQVKRVPLVMRSGEFSHTGFSEHSIHEESKQEDTHQTVTPLQDHDTPSIKRNPYQDRSSAAITRRPRPLSGKSSFSTSRNQYSENPSMKELRRLTMASSKSLGLASKIKYAKPPQPPRQKPSPFPTPKSSFSTYKPSLASLDTTTNERSTLHTQQSSLLQNFDPNDMEKIARNADNLIEIISKIKQQSLNKGAVKPQKRRSIAWD